MIRKGKDTSIRNIYSVVGVDQYYKKYSDSYNNPHSDVIRDHVSYLVKSGFVNKADNVLDLCCGNGDVTSYLEQHGILDVIGCDPYTHAAYRANTGNECLIDSFNDIIKRPFDTNYSVIVCSFGLHLCSASMMELLCYNLSESCDSLIIITPNKKPTISNTFFSMQHEYLSDRVRSRVYSAIKHY